MSSVVTSHHFVNDDIRVIREVMRNGYTSLINKHNVWLGYYFFKEFEIFTASVTIRVNLEITASSSWKPNITSIEKYQQITYYAHENKKSYCEHAKKRM